MERPCLMVFPKRQFMLLHRIFYKPQHIRENIYGKTAIKRFATVDEIANAVAFCLDNQFVNGSVIEVSGGYCFK